MSYDLLEFTTANRRVLVGGDMLTTPDGGGFATGLTAGWRWDDGSIVEPGARPAIALAMLAAADAEGLYLVLMPRGPDGISGIPPHLVSASVAFRATACELEVGLTGQRAEIPGRLGFAGSTPRFTASVSWLDDPGASRAERTRRADALAAVRRLASPMHFHVDLG